MTFNVSARQGRVVYAIQNYCAKCGQTKPKIERCDECGTKLRTRARWKARSERGQKK